MKKIFLLLICFTVSTIAKSQNVNQVKALEMLKTFYTAYMTAFSLEDFDKSERNLYLLRKQYCTSKCRKQFTNLSEKLDADPILKAQDSDTDWIKTLKVDPVPQQPNNFIVSYSYNMMNGRGQMKKETVTIKLALVEEKGIIKLDSFL